MVARRRTRWTVLALSPRAAARHAGASRRSRRAPAISTRSIQALGFARAVACALHTAAVRRRLRAARPITIRNLAGGAESYSDICVDANHVASGPHSLRHGARTLVVVAVPLLVLGLAVSRRERGRPHATRVFMAPQRRDA